MKLIALSQGKLTKVDDEDFDELNEYKWHLAVGGTGHISAGRRKNGKTIFMHRQITKCPDGLEVDHVNGDSLDNRRKNLRVCTHAENLRNRKVNHSNVSGYKGVRNNNGQWQAYITFNRKFIHLGNFDNKIEAAKAYNKASKVYFGEFARMNKF